MLTVAELKHVVDLTKALYRLWCPMQHCPSATSRSGLCACLCVCVGGGERERARARERERERKREFYFIVVCCVMFIVFVRSSEH